MCRWRLPCRCWRQSRLCSLCRPRRLKRTHQQVFSSIIAESCVRIKNGHLRGATVARAVSVTCDACVAEWERAATGKQAATAACRTMATNLSYEPYLKRQMLLTLVLPCEHRHVVLKRSAGNIAGSEVRKTVQSHRCLVRQGSAESLTCKEKRQSTARRVPAVGARGQRVTCDEQAVSPVLLACGDPPPGGARGKKYM